MALRVERGARLRRALGGRSGFVGLAVGLYVAAAVLTAWPRSGDAVHDFVAGGAPGRGAAAPGDHLQTAYHLWLVGHQLGHGHAPWLDPYSFQPETDPVPNLQGWPLGLPFWPLQALFGTVVAWNVLLVAVLAAAGLLACAWLRELGVARTAAVVGGLVFAIAPYRVNQSSGHLLGPISALLPLALLGIERGRRGSWGWLAVGAAALASIPLSGQVHLALGAIPFVCAYALVRDRSRRMIAAVALAAVLSIGIGVVVQRTTISHSILAEGRSLDAVRHYSASWLDFVRRHKVRSERYVFVGWLTPLVALAGLAVLVRSRRGLAVLLGLGAVVPMLLALGTHLPLYSAIWHAFKPFRYPRVPERLLPIACLCIAALVAFAIAELSRRRAFLVAALATVLLFADVHTQLFDGSRADETNAAYKVLAAAAPGRVLELPVFLPDIHYGSVYEYYAMQAPRERPAGYSTVAPVAADSLARKLRALGCGRADAPRRRLLADLGIRYVVLHEQLFGDTACLAATRNALGEGFQELASDGPITLYRVGTAPPRARGSGPRCYPKCA